MAYGAHSVRPAVLQDARSIAQVHVESTQATYKGMFPESWFARWPLEERERSWSERLKAPAPGWVALVGCDDAGQVVGFLCGGAERTGRLGCDGELYAIYLLPAAQRQGLGTLLVRRLVAELRSSGFTSMAVWVLARNPSARFYEAMGGTAIAEQQIERGGEWFVEIAYSWSDLTGFPD